MPPRRRPTPRPTLGSSVQSAATLVAVPIAVQFIEIATRTPLSGFGIHPREAIGLIGILFSPLLHAGPAHLFGNAGPLFVLLTLLLNDPKYRPGSAVATIWIGSGLGTWILGRGDFNGEPTVHIGASSIIYGLVTFLIAAGFRMQSWRAFFISIVVGLAYGGIFYGILPREGPVSWEGHLAGAIAGLFAAQRLHR